MTTTPTTPAALTPERYAEIRAARYTARSLASADIDIDDLLAEIDRLRAERHSTNEALADLTIAHTTETDVLRVEIASAQTQWEHWARETERLQKRVAELERVAVEGRAALANLVDDHDDPGTAALGALWMLSQATTWVDAQPDQAAEVLARHDAQVLRKAAQLLEDTDRDDDAVNLLYLMAVEAERSEGGA